MQYTRNEIDEAILEIAEYYDLKDNYIAMRDNGLDREKRINMIIHKMFIHKFNSYYDTNDESYSIYEELHDAYEKIHTYATEMDKYAEKYELPTVDIDPDEILIAFKDEIKEVVDYIKVSR